MKNKFESKLIAFEWIGGLALAVLVSIGACSYFSGSHFGNPLVKHSMFCVEQSLACK
jgi:hypothetical protein